MPRKPPLSPEEERRAHRLTVIVVGALALVGLVAALASSDYAYQLARIQAAMFRG